MAITLNRYSQLHDYLTQILNLSKKDDLPEIKQVTIASCLKVDSSGVHRFLTHETLRAKKMLTYFIETRPKEYKKRARFSFTNRQ